MSAQCRGGGAGGGRCECCGHDQGTGRNKRAQPDAADAPDRARHIAGREGLVPGLVPVARQMILVGG